MTQKTRTKMGMMTQLLSIIAWAWTGISTVLIAGSAILIGYPLSILMGDKRRRIVDFFAFLWGKALLDLNPLWSVEMSGREKVNKDDVYVIVANHQSLLDILVALVGVGVPFKFMAKKELFKIPFMGWYMSVAGYIPIDRGNKESAQIAVQQARAWLQQRESVLLFPEGTRSLDGEIKQMKAGAFRIAKQECVKLLPVVIEGTGKAIPKNSWVMRRNVKFKIRVLDPVEIDPEASIVDVTQSVRKQMADTLKEMRSR